MNCLVFSILLVDDINKKKKKKKPSPRRKKRAIYQPYLRSNCIVGFGQILSIVRDRKWWRSMREGFLQQDLEGFGYGILGPREIF